jgi:hypothetical protein
VDFGKLREGGTLCRIGKISINQQNTKSFTKLRIKKTLEELRVDPCRDKPAAFSGWVCPLNPVAAQFPRL